jgi:hypothetical protein
MLVGPGRTEKFEADGVTVWQGEALELKLSCISSFNEYLQLLPVLLGQVCRGDLERLAAAGMRYRLFAGSDVEGVE